MYDTGYAKCELFKLDTQIKLFLVNAIHIFIFDDVICSSHINDIVYGSLMDNITSVVEYQYR